MEKSFPTTKLIPFSHWVPYAIAACLMSLGIWQTLHILVLKSDLAATREDNTFAASNVFIGLRLVKLEAKDGAVGATFASSLVMVAWDPYQYRGVVSIQNLPTPPAGHDYQLWVLDPAAETPISAGLLTGSRSFSAAPVSTQNPGFAISLEPGGGSPEPTGPILFAVAPGP